MHLAFSRALRLDPSPTRRRSVASAFGGLLCLLLAAAVVPGRAAEVVLKSGARIDAEVLQKTDQKLVLDLGFDVLSVPAGEIAAESTSATWQTDAPPSSPIATAVSDGKPVVSQPVGSFKDRIDELEEAVVVVSNAGGFGAGFIIDPSGRLLTNYHVVRGEKDNDVTLFLNKSGGKKEKKVFRKVEVKAFSSLLDCALLKIPEKDLEGIELPALGLAGADSLKTSMRVYAIGNPGVGSKMLEHSVSQGILSSTNRNFDDVLYVQTTAAVNPGNSGGPLLNDRGEVCGLVTFRAIWQEGLAFALPVSYLHHFIANAEAYAPSQDSKNTGYRYHNPKEWRIEDEKGSSQGKD